MEQPLISIIVPVYKVEAYLDKCISSIVSQTYQNLEIILVDDGSPDNCPAMCDDWAEKDDRIRVIHKSNGALSDARNAGMAIASGELMGFVDSDDWISPDMYQILYENMVSTDSDLAACGVEMIWEDGRPSRMLTKPGGCVLNREEAMHAIVAESWLKQPVWYKLYKTALVKDIPFPVGKCHEDVFWSYQAVARAGRVSVTDHVGYYYLQRSSSIMGEGYSLKRLDAIEAYEQRNEYMAEYFPELECDTRVGIIAACIFQGQMAIKHLQKAQAQQVMKRLEEVVERHPIKHRDYCEKKLTHRIWLDLARISLKTVCHVKNVLGVGL